MASSGTTSTKPIPLWSALIGFTTLGVLLLVLLLIMGVAVWLPAAARRR